MILFTCIIFELSSEIFYSELMIKFISLQCGLIHFFLSHYQESMTTLKIIYEKITALRQVVCTKCEVRSCTIKAPIRPVLENLFSNKESEKVLVFSYGILYSFRLSIFIYRYISFIVCKLLSLNSY